MALICPIVQCDNTNNKYVGVGARKRVGVGPGLSLCEIAEIELLTAM